MCFETSLHHQGLVLKGDAVSLGVKIPIYESTTKSEIMRFVDGDKHLSACQVASRNNRLAFHFFFC